MNRPKIRGKILTVISAEWTSQSQNIHKSAFWVYVFLTNYHKNPISLIDYELEADFGEGYIKLERVYGDVSKVLPPVITAKDNMNVDIQLKNLRQHLLYKNAKPVRYGEFNHGFVMFAGDDLSLYSRKALKIKFVCIDVFGNRHVICTQYDQLASFHFLQEILDVDHS